MGNTFGQLFRVTTFGESHGGGIGVVIDGCPPKIEISEADIQCELDRRRPGQSKITTQRKEEDRCEILSGIFEGKTLGTPIAMLVRNQDARPEAYAEMKEAFRPSHADFTYEAKYGIRNWQGGGRASARETIGRVAAGAVAIAAGVYELTPIKQHFRRRCRESVGSGFAFGRYCVGSSIGLMLVLVAVSVMSITWMSVIAVLVLAQRVLPWGAAVDLPLALAIVGLGILIVFAPASVPGLTPSI